MIARAGTAAERNARYYAKPKNIAKRKAHDKKRNAEKKVVSKGISVPAVLEYRRGFQNGLEAAMGVVYNHNGGRSFTNTEIAINISRLLADVPAAIVVAGDVMVEGVIPEDADIMTLFLAPRRRS